MKTKLLFAALTTFFAVLPASYAQEHHDDHDGGQRYYDSRHKDYHNWNADEDRNYHRYLAETHHKDRDWNHASKREQDAYWAWRHDHH